MSEKPLIICGQSFDPTTFLLIGKPGKGKSTAATTAIHPTLVIDVDCKMRGMTNVRPLIEAGLVDVIEIREKLVLDDPVYRTLNPDKGPKEQPEGYLSIIKLFNEILEEDPKFDKYNTIVVDSITRISDHLKRLLIHLRGKGKIGKKKPDNIDMDLNWPSWGSYLANLEEMIQPLTQMNKFFIGTVHEHTEDERDESTNTRIVLGYWPMIHGQMMKKLPGYFNEVFFMESVYKKSAYDEYKFRTKGRKYDCARSTMQLDELEDADIRQLLESHGYKFPSNEELLADALKRQRGGESV